MRTGGDQLQATSSNTSSTRLMMGNLAVYLWGRNFEAKDDWILVDDHFVLQYPSLLNEFYRSQYLRTIKERIESSK